MLGCSVKSFIKVCFLFFIYWFAWKLQNMAIVEWVVFRALKMNVKWCLKEAFCSRALEFIWWSNLSSVMWLSLQTVSPLGNWSKSGCRWCWGCGKVMETPKHCLNCCSTWNWVSVFMEKLKTDYLEHQGEMTSCFQSWQEMRQNHPSC